MKLPVYHEKTLELLAVVDVDQSFTDKITQQRSIRLARTPPMSTRSYADAEKDVAQFAVEHYEIRYFPLRNQHGAITIALTVVDETSLKVFSTASAIRVWPRLRNRRTKRKVWKPLGSPRSMWNITA